MRRDAGFTLIEVAISLILIAFGLLGLFAFQAKAQRAEVESYGRVQALLLLQDIIDRMNANRGDAFALLYVTPDPVGGTGPLTECGGTTGAVLDLCEWSNLLKGAAENTGASCDTTSIVGCHKTGDEVTPVRKRAGRNRSTRLPTEVSRNMFGSPRCLVSKWNAKTRLHGFSAATPKECRNQ